MPRIILYIATSLDGYIARTDGSVDWLFTAGGYGYDEFFESIGTLFVGRKTYEQVLSFGRWPYEDRPTYVFSHGQLDPDPHVQVLHDVEPGAIREKVAQSDGDAWLVGGAGLIDAFRRSGLIDEIMLFIHPLLLGEGISLFQPDADQLELNLLGDTVFGDGLVCLHYEVTRE